MEGQPGSLAELDRIAPYQWSFFADRCTVSNSEMQIFAAFCFASGLAAYLTLLLVLRVRSSGPSWTGFGLGCATPLAAGFAAAALTTAVFPSQNEYCGHTSDTIFLPIIAGTCVFLGTMIAYLLQMQISSRI